MCPLIANKVKTNMSLVSIKLFIVRSILCAIVQTYTTYTTTITTIIAYLLNLYSGDLQPQLFSSHAKQLHTRLTDLLLVAWLFLPFFEGYILYFGFGNSSVAIYQLKALL